MNRLVAVTIAALAALACAGEASRVDEGLETSIDTADGIVHVRNRGTPPPLTVAPVARIGSAEGDVDAFGRIRSVIADEHGMVYVADNLAHEIRVFDERGQHVRTLGRQGAGPGEFGDLYSLAWLGGNVAAMDPRNARIGVVSSEGDWIRGIQHYPITGPASLIRLHPLGANGFYAPVISGGGGGLPFVRFTSNGAADTIRIPRRPENARQLGVTCDRPDGGITGIAVPDAPTIAYAFPPAGSTLAVSWTEEYRIALLDSGGDTLRIVSHQLGPVPYPDSLWESAMEPYRKLMTDYPGTRCEPSAPQRPVSRAALRHLAFDERGRMWVEAAADRGYRWDLFDEDGRMVGSAHVPTRSTGVPPYVRNDHLYQVETDSIGVQYVAVYRITRT